MFLTGPQVVRERHGRGRRRRRARRPARSTSATASRTSSRARRRRRGAARARPARPPARDARRARCRAARRPTPPGYDARTSRCRPTSRKVYDVRDVAARDRRRRPAARVRAALGAQHRRRLRPHRRARRSASIANQPQLPRRLLDAESAAEGRPVRAHLQRFGLPLVVLVDTPGLPARDARRSRPASSATAPSSCTRSPRPACRG